MNPEDELSRRWIEIGRMAEGLVESMRIMPLVPQLDETLRIAALKRGSRRAHGGLGGFL